MDLSDWLDLVLAWPPLAVYALLFGGALIEYVFPPFPGDTVVVAGAVLVGAHGWDVGPVAVAVLAGTVVGAALDLAIGRQIPVERLSGRTRETVDRIVAGFRRYGPALLAINRFVPGVRALFFVAAGVAGLRPGPVLGWALVSATAWNVLLIAIGTLLGRNLDAWTAWMARYQLVTGVAVGVGLAAMGVAAWRQRR